jgi:hypothetical protein
MQSIRIFGVFALCAALNLRADPVVWINSSGGSWSDATSWNPNRVPGPGDDAVISVDGTYSVILDVPASVGSLTVGGGVSGIQTLDSSTGQPLTLAHSSVIQTNGVVISSGSLSAPAGLQVNGSVQWVGGYWGGSYLSISPGAFLTVSGPSLHDFPSGALTNFGTVTWISGTIRGGAGGTLLENHGLWDARSDATINSDYGGNSVVFRNTGTFVKSAGVSASGTVFNPGVALQNSGLVDAESGVVVLAGTGSGGGEFRAGLAGTINYSSSFTLGSDASLTGVGTNLFSSGSFSVSAVISPSNHVLLQGGQLASAGFTLAGSVQWTGTLIRNATVTLATNALLTIEGAGPHDMPDTTLTNLGLVQWTGGAIRGGYNGSMIVNRGTWEALTDDVMNDDYGYNSMVFNNLGTLRKAGGTGPGGTTFTGGVVLNNSGGIDVVTGNLNINGGGTSSGTVFAEPATTIDFGNSYTHQAGSLLDGPGTNIFSAGVYTLNGTIGPTNNIVFAGGQLAGTNVVFAGVVQWLGGFWRNATVTIASNATLELSNASNYDLPDSAVTNYGTVRWLAGTIRGGYNGTVVENDGLWLAESDDQINDAYGYNPVVFRNNGVFRKTAGATNQATTFAGGVPVQSAGIFDVQAGVISFLGGITQSGASLGGAGQVQFGSSTVSLGGGVYLTNVFFVGASLAGNNAFSGRLNWDSGLWNNASMTVSTNGLLVIEGGADHDLSSGSLTNNGTIVWIGGRIRGGYNGTRLENHGLFDMQFDGVVNDDYGYNPLVFANFGVVRKSGGADSPGSVFASGVPLYNSGTIDVAVGGLHLNGGAVHSAGSIGGAGTAYLDAGGWSFTGGMTGTNVVFDGGGFIGDNHIVGALRWLGGAWNGSTVTVDPGSTVVITGGVDHDIISAGVTNFGTVIWTGGRIRGGFNGTRFENGCMTKAGDGIGLRLFLMQTV